MRYAAYHPAPKSLTVTTVFDARVRLGVGLLVAFLLLIAGLAYRNTRQLNQDAGWVAHTYEVRILTSSVMLALVDAETEQRGFLITDKDEFLQPYDAALVRLAGLMGTLKDKTRDNPGQQARVAKLAAMTAVRLFQMKEAIDLRRKDEKAAQVFVLSGTSKAQMEAIRRHVADMLKIEDGLLRDRQTKTALAYQLAVKSSLLTVLLGLLGVVVLGWLFRRSLLVRQQAAAVLYEQQERFHLTLESVGDGVIATDIEGKVTFINAVAHSLTGWTPDEARGSPLETVFNIVNEETRHMVVNPALRALKEGRIIGLANHTILISKTGNEYPIDDSAAPIRNKLGKVSGAVLVFRDITGRKQADDRLRSSEAEFRAIFELSPVGKAQISAASGRFQRVNTKFCELTGYSAKELAQMTPAAITLSEDRDAEAEKVASMLRGEIEVYEAEKRYVRKDGKVVWVHVNATLLRDANGRPDRTMAVIQDVSTRKQAEEALRESDQRYRAATAAVSALSWTNNPDGLMKGEQRGWEEFTGQSYEDYQGYGWAKAIHPEDAEPTIEAWNRAVAEKRTFEFEHRVRRRDGEWRACSIRAVPILSVDDTIREWVGVHTDITDQKRNEEKLRQFAAELSEAHHRKDEFLATLAHELRNPLAPIRSGLQLMKLAGPEVAENARLMMERQVKQMVRLLDDLMDLSRISQGKIELRKERVQLEEVLNSALETSRPLIEQMGHELTIALPEQPLIVEADTTRLAQVFLNLLNNAAKYSDPTSRIQLNVERQGREAVVSVKDTGIGISSDEMPRIFDMFAQIDRSLGMSHGGLGIGLTLVRRLIEMHGGTVEARSEGPGRGSEFIVRIPIVLQEASSEESGEERELLSKLSLRILVVDDNRDGADSMAEMLKIMGAHTRTAYDGQEAVDVAHDFRPDVILLDIGLPKLNGYEVSRSIREQRWGKKIVLIAVTGWGQADDRRRSDEAGFDHHMVKPVDPDALMKMLAGLRTHFTRGRSSDNVEHFF